MNNEAWESYSHDKIRSSSQSKEFGKAQKRQEFVAENNDFEEINDDFNSSDLAFEKSQKDKNQKKTGKNSKISSKNDRIYTLICTSLKQTIQQPTSSHLPKWSVFI